MLPQKTLNVPSHRMDGRYSVNAADFLDNNSQPTGVFSHPDFRVPDRLNSLKGLNARLDLGTIVGGLPYTSPRPFICTSNCIDEDAVTEFNGIEATPESCPASEADRTGEQWFDHTENECYK